MCQAQPDLQHLEPIPEPCGRVPAAEKAGTSRRFWDEQLTTFALQFPQVAENQLILFSATMRGTACNKNDRDLKISRKAIACGSTRSAAFNFREDPRKTVP